MNRSTIVPALGALLAGCLSSSPPAAPVRFFDPTPEPSSADRTGRAPAAFRIDGAPHLGREFVVRTGPREVVFDAQHSWIAEPRELVAAAIERRLGAPVAGERMVRVQIDAFELDVQSEPRARVRFVLHDGGARRTIDESAPATDRTPEALAAAMAQVLDRAANAAAAAISGPN